MMTKPEAGFISWLPRSSAVTGGCVAALLVTSVLAADPVPATARHEDLVISGQQAIARGQVGQAIKDWERALQVAARGIRSSELADLNIRLAEAYWRLGRSDESLARLDAAQRLAESLNDPLRRAKILRQRGAIQITAGRVDDARTLLLQALSDAEKLDDKALIAATSNDLGNLAMRQAAWGQATGRYARAAEMARDAGNASLEATARVNQAAALLERGEHGEAQALLDRVASNSKSQADSHDKAMLLIRAGWLLQQDAAKAQSPNAQQSAARQSAFRLFEDARRVSAAIGDNAAAAYAHGYLGAMYEQQGRTEDALRLSQRAVFLAREAGAPESLYRWQWQSARLLKVRGDSLAAANLYRQSVDTLDGIRAALSAQHAGGAGAFATDVATLYREYLTLLLDLGTAATDPATRSGYLWNVQETLERLKAAELQDYFQDECVTAAREKVRRIDQALRPDTVVLYPVVLPGRLVLLMTFASGIEIREVKLDERRLNDELLVFRERLEKRATREYLQPAQQLYQWLIEPIEPNLRSHAITTIVVVPDGALRTIPLAALHDGKQFLIERFAFATTPGIQLTDPRPIDRSRLTVLSSGITESRAGFSGLPFVNAELNRVEKRFGGTRMQDAAFVTRALENRLEQKNFSIVHIASHGKFEPLSGDSFVLAYDGRLSLDQLDRFLSVNRYRDAPVELLTLSACDTAVGNDRAALGLAGIAVKAGVRSALASLWAINDPATVELVDSFYAALQDPALSKAQALQRAQRGMLDDIRYRHPGYWSPYLMIGNWL